jgi:hypothetical protein
MGARDGKRRLGHIASTSKVSFQLLMRGKSQAGLTLIRRSDGRFHHRREFPASPELRVPGFQGGGDVLLHPHGARHARHYPEREWPVPVA